MLGVFLLHSYLKTWRSILECVDCMQVVTLDHDRYERELTNIAANYGKSIKAKDNVKLELVGSGGGDLHTRVPKMYKAIDQSSEGKTDRTLGVKSSAAGKHVACIICR